MDSARLVVGLGLEDQEFQRGLARAQASVVGFTRGMQAATAASGRTFQLPNITGDTRAAVAGLRSMGLSMAEVHKELNTLGLSFDQNVQRFRDARGRFISLNQSMEATSQVIQRMAAEAQQLAQFDAAIRAHVSVLLDGTRMVNTQAASLKELRTAYAQISRDIAATNLPLERRIQLEQQLVRIRQQFAASTKTSAPSSSTLAFGTAGTAVSAQRVATALAQVQKNTEAANRSFALINRQTGEFTQLGRRAANVAIGFGFSLDAIARGGDGAAAGLKTTLRSVAGFAAFFGPGGLIVSGVAAATAAIIELFTKSREEMEKTQKEFGERITEMIKGVDTTGLQQELKNIQEGVLKFNPKTGVVEMVGGIQQFVRDSAIAVQNADTLSGIISRGFREFKAKQQVDSLNLALVESRKQAGFLKNVLEKFDFSKVDAPLVDRTPVKTTIKTGADASKEAFEKLQKEIATTVTSATQLEEAIAKIRLPGGVTTGTEKLGQHLLTQRDLAVNLIGFHDRLAKMLAAEADQGSVAAAAIRTMLADIEKVGDAQALLRARAFVFTMTGEVVVKAAEIQKHLNDVLGRERLVIPLFPVTGPPQVIQLTPLVEPVAIRQALDTITRGERFVIPLFPSLSGDVIPQIISFVANLPKLEVPVTLKPQLDQFGLQNFKALHGLQTFKALLQQINDAQGLLDFSKISGDAGFQRDAEESLGRLQKRMEDYARTIQVAMAIANVPLEVQRKIMAEIVRLQKEIKDDDSDSTGDLADNIRTITTAGRGLLQIADSMGKIGDGARQSIDGVLSLVDSIRTLADARKTVGGKTVIDIGMQVGGFLGALGGVVSILQGLGAEAREREQERNQILRQNNEELARVHLSLAGFVNSLSQQLNLTRSLQTTEMQAILARIARGPGHSVAGPNLGPDFFRATRDFIAQLGRMGLSLDQIAAIAKDAGYTIRDSQGRLIPEAVEQWARGVRLAAEAAFKFRDDLAGLRLRETLRRDVLNLPDTPQVAIDADLSFLKTLAPEVFAEFFGGVDLTDVRATEAAFQRLTQAFLAGSIDWKKLLKFETDEEFIAWQQSVADGFDALREATDAVTRSMQNVPSGLKLQRLIFDATDFTPRSLPTPTLPPAPVLTPRPTLPVPAPVPVPANVTAFDTSMGRAAEQQELFTAQLARATAGLDGFTRAVSSPVVDTSGLQDSVAGIAQALDAAGIRFEALGGPLDGFATALLDTAARISSATVTIPRDTGSGASPANAVPVPVEPQPGTGDVTINLIMQVPAGTPTEMARAVVGELKRVVRAQKGIGFRWSDADLT